MQRQAFKEAEQCYAQALMCRSDAAVFCNRAFARLRLERWQAAEEDATAALQFDLEEKLRIKALFRRGLAREALGHLQAASDDLNAALKAAPGNASISESAQRIYSKLPRLAHKWVPGQPFHSSAVEVLATAIPGSVVGYLWTQSHPCMRFPNHMAVQAHERTGGLLALRESLGAPQRAPRHKEVATKKHDFCESPNFQYKDGLSVEYDVGGNLAKIYSKFAEDYAGPFITFNADASISLRETCIYKEGRVVSKLKSDIPEDFVAKALRMLVVPVKKALGIGLAPNEEELCIQHGVAWDAVPPAELSFARPDVQTPMPFLASEAKVAEEKQAVTEPAAFTPSDCFQGARPNCVFKLGDRGLGYYSEARPIPDGLTWEGLLSAPPQGEVGPAWVGPFGTRKPAAEKEAVPQVPHPQEAPRNSSRRPEFPTPENLKRLQGEWHSAEGSCVGQIQGGCLVWHRSFGAHPTNLFMEDGRVLMEEESTTHSAIIDWGPPARMKWEDGEEWIRVGGSPEEGLSNSRHAEPSGG